MSDDRLIQVVQGIAEIKVNQENLKEDIHDIKSEINYIKEEDRKQNDILAEHIAGVRTNTARLEEEKQIRKEKIQEIDSRLQRVEFLPNLLSGLKKVIIWLGALATAAVMIAKLFGLW